MDTLKLAGGIVLAGVVVYFGIKYGNAATYWFSYESQVQQTVTEMVKPECLLPGGYP